MKVLVTGSHGFIGRHLVDALKKLDYTIEEVDFVHPETPRNMHGLQQDETLDWVFHLGAHTDAQDADANTVAMTNVVATACLAQLFGPRLILASSLMASLENSPYAISKSAAEKFTLLYGGKVVRLPNVYGPGGHSVIDKFAACTKLGTAPVRGDGRQLREYIYVDAAVQAFITATLTDVGMITIRGMQMTVMDVVNMMHLKPKFSPKGRFDPDVGF